MNRQIVFTEKNKAELLDRELSPLADNEVRVETAVSSISCGTEKANITGNANVAGNSPASVEFPRCLGYSSSGIVIEVGKGVTELKVGDRVVMSGSVHAKYNTMCEENLVKISNDSISYEEAALFYIGTFPMAAIRKTKLEIGESCMVMGLGILGLMAVLFAKTAGAVPVIAVDPVKERRDKALKFGADYALDPTEDGFVDKVKELTNGGVKAAVEVTGLGVGLEQCLDCMAKFGRVALLGCTRDKNFTIDYYRKVHFPGITLIGAHTMARPQYDSSQGWFTGKDDITAIMKLSEYGRINFKDMIDETFLPEDCKEVYTRLINDRNFPVVSQFDWRNTK